ncbi:MAG: DUF502 domain-containing protein [Sandaracinaceae bacterium]|nr:DUF502 domain-containing protein [Sandaracinaceae bacterium]
MRSLAKHFFQGLLVFVPTVGSIYVVWWVLHWLDSLYPLPIPGLGIVLALVALTLLGFLTSNVVGRSVVGLLERGMKRLPVVNLLYSSLKDLLGAFVGDRKSFDKPVMVTVDPVRSIRVFGFVTCDRFDDARLGDHVAVYLPQSYNFAGNLLVVRRDLVEPVDADPAQFMAFIVSGGVAEMSGARTVFEDPAPLTRRKPAAK